MLFLGLIAIIQTIFLPGILILYFARIKTQSTIQKYIYTFALSLFANYSIVTILVIFKVYLVTVMFSISIIEVLTLVYLLVKKRVTFEHSLNFNLLFQSTKTNIAQNVFAIKFLLIGSIVVLLFYFALFISNIGTIFYFVDTVNNIHWNTWAIDFANNIFPKQSSHFPQLIPSNWSISYLLIDEANIHFFTKSFMPLFFLGNVLMFFDLALQKRKSVHLIALIIYGFIAPIVYTLVFIADGNGDLPVSFFAFLSFYAYLKTNKDEFVLKEFILVFLFASTAAGTKLAGFYVFFFMSILCLFYLIKNLKLISKKDLLILIISVILILGLNLFWYFLKPGTMTSGLHQPEWLQTGYYNILSNALHLMYYNIGLPVLAFLIITVLFSLFVKDVRIITMIFVIPPIILWMFKYSSDFRNLSFVIPFISYASASGFIKILEIIRNKKNLNEIKNADSSEVKASTKKNWNHIIVISSSLLFFIVVSSNWFYNYLYIIYSSISKYYFYSNRITYLIDYTFFLPVDYYQKTIAVLFLITAITSVLIFFKVKVKYFVAIVLSVIVVSSFLISSAEIREYQQTQFLKVDARNYYSRINTIINSAKLNKNVLTNFPSICSEKIPREINFTYLDETEILKILNGKNYSQKNLLFLRVNNLNSEIKSRIISEIKSGKYQALYDDGDYLFIKT